MNRRALRGMGFDLEDIDLNREVRAVDEILKAEPRNMIIPAMVNLADEVSELIELPSTREKLEAAIIRIREIIALDEMKRGIK